ncbi:ornithine cyclodeaminase [Candidatus Termititenax persephonae]|uniref:Ornithine cyclodeaminase n=1 Tax=Candidatus Termititenax persephonae TaxID=2218525 RepID=A0A388TH99_9BACT|nr:ornithine cyclodeaminase [Candidatus Termititenax persephonae]
MSSAKVDFLYLNEEDMLKAGVTDMAGCVAAMEDMFAAMGAGDYMMGGANQNSHGIMLAFPDQPEHPGMPKNGPDRRFMAMPAYLGGKFQIAGMKWYGSNVENKDKGLPRSILMVFLTDKDTGAPLALLSANLLSACRTGAIPGVGAKWLSRPDSKVVGVIGPGVMSKTALDSFVVARPGIDTVQICGRSQRGIDSFAAYVREKQPQIKNIKVAKTFAEAVDGADIISVATSSPLKVEDYPYLEEKWLKPGALLTLPGSIRLDDDFLLKRAGLVVDNWKLYEAWGEEIPYPVYANGIPLLGAHLIDLFHDKKIERSQIRDIGEIIAGKIPARKSAEEILVLSVGGMPTEDLAWGLTVYQNAVKKGLGQTLKLWDVPAMT